MEHRNGICGHTERAHRVGLHRTGNCQFPVRHNFAERDDIDTEEGVSFRCILPNRPVDFVPELHELPEMEAHRKGFLFGDFSSTVKIDKDDETFKGNPGIGSDFEC